MARRGTVDAHGPQPFEGADDLNADAAIQLDGVLFMEGEGEIVAARQGPDDLLTPWQGLGVFFLWTAALMLVANYLLRHRDA